MNDERAELQELTDRMLESPITRLGITADPLADEPNGVIVPYPNVCRHGLLRATVHVMMVDMLAGFIAEKFSDSDWVFTADLSSWCPPRPAPARIDAKAALLRRGRNLVTAEVTMTDGSGASFGYGQASYIRVARRHGDPPRPHLTPERRITQRAPLKLPLEEAIGIEVVDASAGRVSVVLRDDLRNPAGAMQGAMVASVGERAAEVLAEHVLGRPCVVTHADVRYLAMGRTGPVVSSAAFIGDPANGSIHVELYDTGESNRLMTTLIVRVWPVDPRPGL